MRKLLASLLMIALFQGSTTPQTQPNVVVWRGELGAGMAHVTLVGMRYAAPGETVDDVRRAIWDGYRGRGYESWWPSD